MRLAREEARQSVLGTKELLRNFEALDAKLRKIEQSYQTRHIQGVRHMGEGKEPFFDFTPANDSGTEMMLRRCAGKDLDKAGRCEKDPYPIPPAYSNGRLYGKVAFDPGMNAIVEYSFQVSRAEPRELSLIQISHPIQGPAITQAYSGRSEH